MTQYLNVPPVLANPNNCNLNTLVDIEATFADVIEAGYLNTQKDKGHVFTQNDLIFIKYDSGITGFSISIDNDGVITLSPTSSQSGSNLIAGGSGVQGYVASYPASASTGYLKLQGVANSGDYITTISNASHGQATVYSIPDVGASTGQFLVKTAALVDGNFVAASGTAGKTVDSGYNVNNVLQYASVAVTAAEFNGMYAAPKLLIAAPGANNLIVVDRMELVMTFGSAAFASGGVVAAQYDSTANGAGVKATNTEDAADFTGAAASTTFLFSGASGNSSQAAFSTTVNKGLYLSNQTGAFTTGTGCSFVCKIHYRIIATA